MPRLPFLGSMVPRYSNSVPFELDKVYDYWYESWKKFGDFYRTGLPFFVGEPIDGEGKQWEWKEYSTVQYTFSDVNVDVMEYGID